MENETTPQAETTPTETVTLTMSELNARMAAARRSGVESATRKVEPATQPVAVPAQAPTKDSSITDALAAMQARLDHSENQRAFERAIAGHGLDDAKAALMFRMAQAEKPADLSTWIADTVAVLGLNATQRNAPAAAPASIVHRNFDIASATEIIPWDALSPEQKSSDQIVRQRHEHNMKVNAQRSGAPPRKR